MPAVDQKTMALVTDLANHVATQCEAAIERGKQLLPAGSEHLLTLNVISFITALAVRDALEAYQRELPNEPTPTFEKTVDAVFARIKELAMQTGAPEAAARSGLIRS